MLNAGNEVIINIHPDWYREHKNKYLKMADKKVVKLIYYLENKGLWITDFFIPEAIKKNNDFIHYGFLKVSDEDLVIVTPQEKEE